MRLPQYRGPGGAGNFSGGLSAARRRLYRFLFNPPPLGLFPRRPAAFAQRLAGRPVDLVTHLGMVRSNAYFDAGCPLELCDQAAARDLWAVIYQDVLESAPSATSAPISAPSAFASGRPNTASLTHRPLPRKS